MASLVIILDTDAFNDDLIVDASRRREAANEIANKILAVGSGSGKPSDVLRAGYSGTTLAAASGSIAVTNASVSANDTVTIGGVALTAKASGANGTSEFNKGGSSTITATNLANTINANTTLNKSIVASAATGTVTCTALVRGAVGNLVTIATSNGTGFGVTAMANGAGTTTTALTVLT